MYCTCSLSAEPVPTTASLIWRGVNSPHRDLSFGAGDEGGAARLPRGERRGDVLAEPHGLDAHAVRLEPRDNGGDLVANLL